MRVNCQRQLNKFKREPNTIKSVRWNYMKKTAENRSSVEPSHKFGSAKKNCVDKRGAFFSVSDAGFRRRVRGRWLARACRRRCVRGRWLARACHRRCRRRRRRRRGLGRAHVVRAFIGIQDGIKSRQNSDGINIWVSTSK